MTRIPVCYCGNRRIFGGVFMSMLSVIKHTSEPLQVILMTMDISYKNEKFVPFTEEQRALLERTVKRKNPESTVEIIDVSEYQKKYFDGGKNQNNSYTPYTNARLFLDLLEVPDKIIYLDADVMCCSDIKEHFDIDIEGYEFAATLDVVGHRFFPRKYCNAGVLMLNIPKIRETGLFEKARVMVRTRSLMMPDQSAINRHAKAKLVLPYRFNEQRDIKPETVYKHFCKGYKWWGPILTSYNIKQWHRDKVHEKLGIHTFDDIYEEYDRIIAEAGNRELIEI